MLEGRINEGKVPDETKRLFTFEGLLDILAGDSELEIGRGVKTPILELQGLYT
jgi:hypothetical protein